MQGGIGPDRVFGESGAEPTRYSKTEAASPAFVTALHLLPPLQRATLVLRDVLGYQTADVARMLDTTQEAVDSALPRARATVDGHLRPPPRPDPHAEDRLVARLTDALQRADLEALLRLLLADVRLSMPPAMLEYRGVEQARRVFATVTFRPGRVYHVVPTRANGQPAFGMYLADPHASVYRPYALLVITTAGDRVTAITVFSPDVMPRFGLPRTLPQAD